MKRHSWLSEHARESLGCIKLILCSGYENKTGFAVPSPEGEF
jgi:hypothetical protein